MWAWAYEGKISIEHLHEVVRVEPSIGPYGIIIDLKAAALNYRDLAIARRDYHVTVDPPLIPLSDGAGIVTAVGKHVTRFSIGDLVCPLYLPEWIDGPPRPEHGFRRLGGPQDGVMRERMCVHEREAVRIPDYLTPIEAACLPVTGVTAWQQLCVVDQLRPGEWVLVQGTGGISTAAMQIALISGCKVAALTRSTAHEAALKRLGVDVVLQDRGDEEWRTEFCDLTRGAGADVFVNVAGAHTISPSVRALRMGGRLHLVGYSAGTIASLDIFDAIRHAVRIHIATAGHRTSFEALARALEEHRFHPPIASNFPAGELIAALLHLEQGGHFGKVVIDFTT